MALEDDLREALDAGDQVALDAAIAHMREHWSAIRERGGDPAAIAVVVDKRVLDVTYLTTDIKPAEAFYYLSRAAHDFLTDDFEGADDA